MLELAALGFLYEKPLHGYRLKQQLEVFMGSVLSANYGAIYPLLKRLEQRDYIKTGAEEPGAGGPNRRIYCITAAGQEHWHQIMMEHPQESWINARSRFMIKFFFFAHLQSSERTHLMEFRLMSCRLRLQGLEEKQVIEESEDRYKALAWQRHMANLRFEIDWLEQQIQAESEVG
jgi:DNA-binding PadR family transcriptional regulator